MEFYLSRAMEVCRLSESQLEALHTLESNENLVKNFKPSLGTYEQIEARAVRCLMPFEISEKFTLPLLKEAYLLPDDEIALSAHNQRLRNDFKRLGVNPRRADLSPLDVETVHLFDRSVKKLNDSMQLDLVYRGGERKKRVTKDFD